jgi:hypothetical protein
MSCLLVSNFATSWLWIYKFQLLKLWLIAKLELSLLRSNDGFEFFLIDLFCVRAMWGSVCSDFAELIV